MHAHHCSLFKTGRKIMHKKEFNWLLEVKYVCKFELMFGYMWRAIYHAVYKNNLRAQVDSCCILFEYLLMHTHEGTSGTRMLIQNVPMSIF